MYTTFRTQKNGATVEFEKVLLVDNNGTVTVGAPTVEGAKVVCEVDISAGKRRQSTCIPQEEKKRLQKTERSPPAVYRVNY